MIASAVANLLVGCVGLGQAQEAGGVVVRWSSGTVGRLTQVATDPIIEIAEGRGVGAGR